MPYTKDISKENEKLLLAFQHNSFLKSAISILYFFLLKEILFNNNLDIKNTKNQFAMENINDFIMKETNLLEEHFDFLYYYLKKILNSLKHKDSFGEFKPLNIKKILTKMKYFSFNSLYLVRTKTRFLISSKHDILKRLVDISSLLQNQIKFKSIFPHPSFQKKKCSLDYINIEENFSYMSNIIFSAIQYENIEIIKEIFTYFIDKILQKKEILALKKDEYTYHLSMYRTFGSFLNSFCFDYALRNKTNINDAIKYVKNNIFRTKDEMQKLIDLILNDYYKMFGFIIGIRNEYFNYYDLQGYNIIYFNYLKDLKKDFTLLKYLISMSEKKIDLETILKYSNLENVYDFFNKVFNPKNETEKIKKDEDENKHIMQWRRIFETIISIIKNDYTPLWSLLYFYNEIISLNSKNFLFNKIRSNKNLMKECRNILKERLVQNAEIY